MGSSLIENVEPVQLSPYIYTNEIYGAFDSETNKEIEIYGFAVANQTLKIEYYHNTNNTLLGVANLQFPSGVALIRSLNYIVRTKERLSNSGLRLVFSLINKKDECVWTSTVLLYPSVNDSIISTSYKYNPYVINNRTFKLESDGSVSHTSEYYQFLNTVESISIKDDYSINLEEISFTYCNGEKLINKDEDMYLVFDDKDHSFTSIDCDINGKVKIPLKAVQNGNEITFDYKNKMYVNPSSLEMSLEPKFGFEETDNFYISPNKQPQISSNSIEIYLHNFGRNNIDVHIPLNAAFSNSFIGSCYDSDFCIDGGIKK